MDDTTKENSDTVNPVVTREYNIKGTTYLVTATTRDGVSQDATSIILRLIQKDIRGTS